MTDEILGYGDVEMDLAAHRVRRAGLDIHLGPTEFRLLRHFMEHPGRVFSREQLLDAVWGVRYFGTTRTLDQCVAQLRKKIGDAGTSPQFLRTVHGVGYRLDQPA